MQLTSKFAGEQLAPSIAVLDSTEATELSTAKDPACEEVKSDDIPDGVSTSARLLKDGSPSTTK